MRHHTPGRASRGALGVELAQTESAPSWLRGKQSPSNYYSRLRRRAIPVAQPLPLPPRRGRGQADQFQRFPLGAGWPRSYLLRFGRLRRWRLASAELYLGWFSARAEDRVSKRRPRSLFKVLGLANKYCVVGLLFFVLNQVSQVPEMRAKNRFLVQAAGLESKAGFEFLFLINPLLTRLCRKERGRHSSLFLVEPDTAESGRSGLEKWFLARNEYLLSGFSEINSIHCHLYAVIAALPDLKQHDFNEPSANFPGSSAPLLWQKVCSGGSVS